MTIVRTYNQSGDVAINDAPAQIVRVFEGASGTNGTNGTDGQDGADGVVQSVVAGTNVTVDSTDPANPIVSATGGTGAVDSVNGQTGTVVLGASDVSADPAGSAVTAQSTAEGYTDTSIASEVTRANAAYDAAGAAATAQAASQPLDSDLTAIAALTTTTFGRALLALADAAALRTAGGLGTAATSATGDFDASGAAAAAQAASQPLDSDLTAIAALTTTTFGRSLLTAADAAAARVLTGAGTSSLVIGTTSTTAKAGDYQPASTNISDATTVGKALIVATDAAAARTATGSAPLASPAFTGNPTAPTPTAGDNDTSIATTAFVTTAVAAGGGGGLSAIPVARTTVTSGNKTLGATSYAAVDTGGAFDVTIAAAAGDVIELHLSTLLGASGNTGGGNNTELIARTRVSSADVNTISGASASVTAWFAWDLPNNGVTVSGSAPYTVVSGDISSGNVTFRLYYRTALATPTKTMFANTGNPTVFTAKNLKH